MNQSTQPRQLHPSRTGLVRGGCRAPITDRERLRRRCCILGLSELPLTDVLDCAPYTPWWRRASTPALRSTCSPPGAGDSSAGSSSSAALPCVVTCSLLAPGRSTSIFDDLKALRRMDVDVALLCQNSSLISHKWLTHAAVTCAAAATHVRSRRGTE